MIQRVFERKGLLIFALLFLMLTLSRLHGFSVSMWHEVVDLSPKTEDLFGESRPIRSDDWLVLLPFLFSQSVADPVAPLVNPYIGEGQNMMGIANMPILNETLIFRLQSAGFLISPDIGMSWMWWFRVLGILGSCYLAFLVLTKGNKLVSAIGAGVVLSSPFVQFWSLNMADVIIYPCLCLWFFARLLESDSNKWLQGLGLGWAGASFVYALYPPYQVLMGYFFLAAALGLVLEKMWGKQSLPFKGMFGGIGLGLAILAAGVWMLWRDLSPVLPEIMNTVYPGTRISLGGDISLARMFLANSLLVRHMTTWDGFGHNICEGGTFLLFFPIIIGWGLWLAARKEWRIPPSFICMAILTTVMALWMLIGFPEALAKITQFYRVPGPRAAMGLGMADTALAVIFLGRAPVFRKDKLNQWALAGFGATWALLLFLLHQSVLENRPYISEGAATGFAIMMVIAGILIMRRNVYGMALALVLVASQSMHFNPVALGGYEFIQENKLSREMVRIDQRSGGQSKWAVFGSITTSNIPRMLGIESISGVYFYPQHEIWGDISQSSSARQAYNRYAHTLLEPVADAAPKFKVTAMDTFVLEIDPKHPFFEQQGVTHYLVESHVIGPFMNERFRKEFDFMGRFIFTDLKAVAEAKTEGKPSKNVGRMGG